MLESVFSVLWSVDSGYSAVLLCDADYSNCACVIAMCLHSLHHIVVVVVNAACDRNSAVHTDCVASASAYFCHRLTGIFVA